MTASLSTRSRAAAVVLAVASCLLRAQTSRGDLSSNYDGQLTINKPPANLTANGTLTQMSKVMTGTITVNMPEPTLTGTFSVQGKTNGRRFRLRGKNSAGAKFLWAGKVEAGGPTGRVWIWTRGLHRRGTLAFVLPGAGGPGGSLFSQNCVGCHGGNARGLVGPDIHCNKSIHDTVRNGRMGPLGTMPAFTALTDSEIASIQSFLDGLCPVSNPTDLFASNCASCHGSDARGLVGPDIHCNKSIHDTVRNGATGALGTMPAFASLADADIAVIQSFLDSLCPAPTGPELFAGNCAPCHSSNAAGTAGRPNIQCTVRSRIFNAVRRGRGSGLMPIFPASAMPDSQVDQLVAYLASLCSGLPGDRFASNCATCHGATAGGGRNADNIFGPNIRCTGTNDFLEKVQFGSDAMPPFPELTATNIGGIAGYVHQNFCPLGG
ncbi:MAG: c-type cytochrome [Deltaproteobacteria bacterium]|nr:c-type cytochrome [Deltaproteobacteria bacterium]